MQGEDSYRALVFGLGSTVSGLSLFLAFEVLGLIMRTSGEGLRAAGQRTLRPQDTKGSALASACNLVGLELCLYRFM